MVDDA